MTTLLPSEICADTSDRGEVARLRATVSRLEGLLEARERAGAAQDATHGEVLGRLARSEANFKTLVEQAPDPVFVHRGAGIVYANPAMARLVGRENHEELLGRDPLDCFVHPDDREMLVDFKARRDAGEAVAEVRVRWVRRDGATLHVRAHSATIMFDDAPAILVIAHDVTARTRAEAAREAAGVALRLSEERYRVLFDRSPLPLTLFDAETLRILAVNDTGVALYGWSREEFLGMRMTDLKLPGAVPLLVRGMEEARSRAQAGLPPVPWRGTTKHLKKDGAIFDVEIAAHAVVVDGRRAMLSIGVDVTEKRRLEEQLRQAQKMEAIGQLAGGMAHDFNNIVAVILADSHFAMTELGDGHPVCAEIKEIETAALRAAALTRQLLTFSRQQPTQPRILALNSVVTHMEKMLCRIIGEDLEMSAVLATRLGSIEADPGQLEQVLMNLVVNARDAMPNGGKLTIETHNVELDDAHAAEIGVSAGRYVMLAVSDTGCGMDAATRVRVFEPFFTTKGVGKGTGLGLSTAFGIVKQSGGGMSVYSEVDRGTTFKIYFPRVAAPADSLVPLPSAPVLARGSETVLVVEDDHQVRRVVRRLLASQGYTVLEARNAQAALATLHERGEEVQLVLTDLVMPGMDGRSMIAKVLEERPGMRVIYMSGYTEHAAVKGAALGPGDNFIQKPFTVEQMTVAIRRALDQGQGGTP